MATIQTKFAENATKVLQADPFIVGLAVAGSWLTQEMDEFSDLDLILVTKERISDDKNKMLDFAGQLGYLLTGFTGEHVGEPRVLICLYDQPLLHVDIKFLSLEEFYVRIEDPVILLDNQGQLQSVINQTPAKFPYPDYQWIEDRFWIWIHYALLKIGRGELMEACDFFGYLRMVVLGPLLHIKNGNLPRGVRKVETQLLQKDFQDLKLTLPTYSKQSLLDCLHNAVELYKKLRSNLFAPNIVLQQETEKRVVDYFAEIKGRDIF